jgi:cytidyltransferase-like protein
LFVISGHTIRIFGMGLRVYTAMVGDLFHMGHVNLLKQAKACGDWLIVGVCGDAESAYYKRKPIMNVHERYAVIEACRFVDEVILDAPSVVTLEFMERHKIDLIVHADDSTKDQLLHFYRPAIESARYKSLPYTLGISTSEIIKRITQRPDQELDRKIFVPVCDHPASVELGHPANPARNSDPKNDMDRLELAAE